MTAQGGCCVILPTRNELDNIAEVLRRLDELGCCAQLIVVDDSDDGTADRAREIAGDLTVDVSVHHRSGAQREGGLGTAIVDGLERSAASHVVVMDADLQHPPELVPVLVDGLADADLVIASRFNWDNVIAGLSPLRRRASRACGALAFRLFPSELANVSDPMSGYFAFRRDRIDVERLNPLGYKILLELLGTHSGLVVSEVPFSFGRRLGGESKAGVGEGIRFVRHVVDLRRRRASVSEARRIEVRR